MSYLSEVLADSPLAFWRLGESSQTAMADASGNGRDGGYAGMIFGAGGAVGDGNTAVRENGATARGLVTGAPWMDVPTWTAEVWVKHTNQSGGIGLLTREAGPGQTVANGYIWSLQAQDTHWVAIVFSGGAAQIVTNTANIADGQWHHLAATWDGSTLRTYTDGVPGATLSTGAITRSASTDIVVGNSRATGLSDLTFGLYGLSLDEAAFYATALSAARIKAHYDASLVTPPPSGSISGSFTWAGSASGQAPATSGLGAASGTFKWIGSSNGKTSPSGAASGTFAWVGVASGSTTATPQGSASGSFRWAGTARGGNGTTSLDPWTADRSRRTRLVLVTSGSFDFTPPLELPPAGFVERPILRKSVAVPALNTISGALVTPMGVRVPDDAYDALPTVVEEIGVPHVIIGNHDVTYFRGGLTKIVSFQAEEPFGDLSATIDVPQITSYDEFPDDSNVHPLNWSRIRANVFIVLKRPDGSLTKVWGGHVVSHDTGNDENGTTKRLTCVGSLWQASTDIHQVPTMLDPTDIGTLVPKALNSVASRRYPPIPKVSTGIRSRQRGSWSDSPLAYAQGLLATAFTAGGNQWTVAKVPNTWRRYEMRKKSQAPSWTVTNGARGVTVDLTRDGAAVRNVIYGHGVGPDGYAWWNYHYPNLRMDDAPLFPGVIMSAGSTDASSNGGVSLWQARARDLGYHIEVDGTLTSGDVTTIEALQRKYGVQVDGQIGPQTWAATFDVGGNGGDLSGAIRLPLAADPRTQRYLYNADGSVAGDNPTYDKNHLIYAADVDFGSGTTREQALEDAQLIVDREQDPAITGRIVLRSDPREGSRILIRPGDKLRLIGYEGADRVLHIARVDFDMDSQSMTLEVDERGRDAMTLTEIRERNKEARRDPARRPGNVNRRSRLDVDSVVPFDGESGAGRIPKFAVYGGLWSVIRVPVSSLGRIASVDVSTSGPAAEFVMGLFGKRVTPARLLREVGNPLAFDDPFNKDPAQARRLDDDLGFIEGFGSKSSPAGYWPKQKGQGPITGRLVDTGGVEYVSAAPPWVWVAVYSPTTTFVSGRLLPAPIQ